MCSNQTTTNEFTPPTFPPTFPPTNGQSTATMDSTVECVFEQKIIISNFSHLKNNNHLKNQLISSDTIDNYLETKRDIIAHLDFGIIEDNYFSIFVCLESLEKCQFKAVYRLSVQDYDGNDYSSNVYEKIVHEQAENYWKTNFELDYLQSNFRQLLRNDQLTILCKIVVLKIEHQSNSTNFAILNGQPTKPNLEPFEFNAKMRLLNSFVHNWTIDSFSNFYNCSQDWKVDDLLKLSCTFDSTVHKNVQFHFGLHPNGDGSYRGHSVSLFLCHTSPKPVRVMVRYKMSIVDRTGTKCNTKGGQGELKEKEDSWGPDDYISITTLLEQSNRLFPNDRMVLYCEVQVIDNGIDELVVVNEEQIIRLESYLNAKPIIQESIAHKWTIDNVGSFYGNDWETIRMDSNTFKSDKLDLQLSLCQNDPNDPNDPIDDDNLSMYLDYSSRENDEWNVCWKISIINAKDEKCHTRVCQDEWQFDKYINLPDLLEPSSELLHEGRLTLYCEILITESEQKMKSNESEIQIYNQRIILENPRLSASKFKIISLVHLWTVENFGHFYSDEWTKENLKIVSNKFRSNSNKLQFHLSIFPNGFKEEYKDHVSIFLHHSSTGKVNEFVRMRLSIINEMDGKCHNVKYDDLEFNGNKDSYGFRDYIEVETLRKSDWYNDNLKLMCEVIMIDKESEEMNAFEEDARQSISETYFNAKPRVRDLLAHKWRIDQFGHFMDRQKCSDNNFEITSNQCRFSSNSHFELCFRLKATENGSNISVDLISHAIRREYVQLCVALIDNEGKKCYISFRRTTKPEPKISCSIREPIPEILSQLLQNDSLIVYCEVSWLENATIKASQLDSQSIQQEQINLNPTQTSSETSTKFLFHTHNWTIANFGAYRNLAQDKPKTSVDHYFECENILNENILHNVVANDSESVQLSARLYPKKREDSLQVFFRLNSNCKRRIVRPLMSRIKNLSKKENSNDCEIFKTVFSKTKVPIQISYNEIRTDCNDLALEIEFYTYTNSASTEVQQNPIIQFTLCSNFSNPWKPERVNNDSTNSSSVTSIRLVPCNFEWEIDTRQQSQQLESPKYLPLVEEQLKIYLKRKYKSINLCSENRDKPKIDIWVHMAILDRQENIFFKKDDFLELISDNKEWKFLEWISSNQLVTGCLKIKCELTLFKEKTEHKIPVLLKQIQNDLSSLLTNEPQTNVVFHFWDQRKLHAHSSILSFRSNIFEYAFKERGTNQQQICINFSDVETFEAMLRFVYTEDENFAQIVDRADKLLPLANKLNLDSLKEICEDMLIEKLNATSLDNIMQSPELPLEVLLLANEHNANRLKSMAMKIINENMKLTYELIKETNVWQEIKANNELFVELFLSGKNGTPLMVATLKRKRSDLNSV